MPQALVAAIHTLRWEELPPPIQQTALWLLLDLLGVAAAGSRTRLARIIADHAAAHYPFADHLSGVTAGPRLLFDGRRVSPMGAALAAGMTIDAVDGHDGHNLTKGHVGCASLAALLALVDGGPAISGRALLTALTLGYEVGTRCGIALHRLAPDYHCSGAWMAVGCAALAARHLRLDPAQTLTALGIAAFHGPRAPALETLASPSMVKDAAGWGASAGISAALLAADGLTGPPPAVVTAPAVADLWLDLGQRWRILETYIKPYPICRWAHPAVHATLWVCQQAAVPPERVQAIEVASFAAATHLEHRRPTTTEQAQYALPFAVAAAVVHGRLDERAVADGALNDPQVLRLAAQVRLSVDPQMTACFPDRRQARVRLVLKDGRTLVSPVMEAPGEAPSEAPSKASSEAPGEVPLAMPPTDLIAEKVHGMAGRALGAPAAAALMTEVLSLAQAPSVAPLLDQVLTRPEQSGVDGVRHRPAIAATATTAATAARLDTA